MTTSLTTTTTSENQVLNTLKKQTVELNWEVQAMPMRNHKGEIVSDLVELVRSDNGKKLRYAPPSYHFTPNAVFMGLVQKIITASHYELFGYGEINGGKKLYAYLKNPNLQEINGFKQSEFLSVGNSHDGSSSFFISTATVLHRCSNQFGRIWKDAKLRFNHTKGSLPRIEALGEAFGIYQSNTIAMYDMFEQMASIEATKDDIQRVYELALKIGKNEKLSTRKSNLADKYNISFAKETGELGMNLFGIFNAVTHFTTHVKSSKNSMIGNFDGYLGNINNAVFNYCAWKVAERKRNLVQVSKTMQTIEI